MIYRFFIAASCVLALGGCKDEKQPKYGTVAYVLTFNDTYQRGYFSGVEAAMLSGGLSGYKAEAFSSAVACASRINWHVGEPWRFQRFIADHKEQYENSDTMDAMLDFYLSACEQTPIK